MASGGGHTATAQQLAIDIQNELNTANQLTELISNELQLIKNFTNPGGKFESNIKKNARLILNLAETCQIDIENIPPLVRTTINLNTHDNQNKSYAEHNTFQNESEMEDTQ